MSVDKRTRAWLRAIWWLLVLGGFVLAAISTYEGRFKSTEAYKGALAAARTDPELIEAIGAPIHEGLFRRASTGAPANPPAAGASRSQCRDPKARRPSASYTTTNPRVRGTRLWWRISKTRDGA